MMRPNEDIVAGYTPVMPTYEGLLPSAEVAALVEYIKALRDVESASSVDAPALLPGSTSVVAPGSLTVTAPASGTPVPHPEVNP
jgi:cytochrome c oxidase subunit 2